MLNKQYGAAIILFCSSRNHRVVQIRKGTTVFVVLKVDRDLYVLNCGTSLYVFLFFSSRSLLYGDLVL